MKLATYKDGSRDGQLVVVSRDLVSAHYATGIATGLQQVLDDWNFLSPQLQDLYETLNGGKARHAFPFDPRLAMAPLPRVPLRAVAPAYPSHVRRRARAEDRATPDDARPALRMVAGTPLLGATESPSPVVLAHDADFEAGIAVLTGDLPPGVEPASALEGVRLLLLTQELVLRALEADDDAAGLGAQQARPTAWCAPVAVTPDELGAAWHDGRLDLALTLHFNGRRLGRVSLAEGLRHGVGELLAVLARTRPLTAGTLVGLAPASAEDAAQGVLSLAEKRALEALEHGSVRSAWLRPGDRWRAEVEGRDGESVFGAIDVRLAGDQGTSDAGAMPSPATPAATGPIADAGAGDGTS